MPRATITIDSIAAGGDGVGRHEGLVVFVPRTAPGDRAVVDYEITGRLARGRLLSLEAEGPGRAVPGCQHYVADNCGGCQLQHLQYDVQREAKAGIVHDALSRIGRRTVQRPEVESSDQAWRYRAKLTLALRRKGSRWIGGLHPYDDPGAVFAVQDCPITDERVVAAWRGLLDGDPILPDADELRGAVRLLDEGAALVIEGGTTWDGAGPNRLLENHGALSGIWWARDGERPKLVAERGGQSLGASFAQVNPPVAERLRAYVIDRVLAHEPAGVIDAYSGSGSTAVPIAERGIVVTAIERDRAAAKHVAQALRHPSRSVTGAVEDIIARALPADVVILNPPRGGVHRKVTETLAATRPQPRAIVYVSCNPATLARDLKALPGYRIASLRSFDMFPQTAHVETVCELVPGAAA